MSASTESNIKAPKWIAKVGMILIKLTDRTLIDSLDRAWDQTDDHRGYYEQTVNIHRDVEAVLRKCPDVKNIRWLGDLREEHFEPFEHDNVDEDDRFLQEASAFLYFELFIPKSERRYAFDVRYHDNVLEKAHVIYNGALFLTFAEIKDETSTAFFGQEIREFLARRLVSNRWKALAVPPCPLHPDILITASSNSEGLDIRTDEENDIAVVLPLSETKNIVDFLEYFLFENSFSISHFLSVCTKEQRTETISRLIENILDSLTDTYAELLKLPWYKFRKKLSLMRYSRQMALSLQMKCNEFAKCRLALRRAKGAFGPQTAESWNDTPFRPYFFKHLDEPGLSLSEIRDTVKHMTDIVSQRYLQYFTVFAALAGGIVGAIITNVPFIYAVFSKWFKN
ncbi:MAG: hypothetical protein R6U40_03540 [Desulfobacterales bacterium]